MKLSSLQKGLVGHWTMAQDSLKGSLLADKTPYENDGTIYGATFTTDRKGKANSAMSFDGVDDYIDCSFAAVPIGDFSISLWCYKDSLPNSYESFLGQYLAADSGRFWFGFNNSNVGFRIGEVYHVVRGVFNKYSHYMLVKKDSNIKMYVDNAIKIDETIEINVNQGIPTTIGGYGPNVGLLNGYIDDVRIYNRALSQEEITLLYNSYNPKIQL